MLNPAVIAELRDLAGRSQMRWIDAFSSWSTKDRADAYLYKLSQMFYEAIANGADVETTLVQLDIDWRKYATEQNKRIEGVGKFSHGPYKGQSTAMDSYVYPDKFGSMQISLRNMIKILVERFEKGSDDATHKT